MSAADVTVARGVVAAHRGASRSAPENTLAAFETALAGGARAVELDVHLTGDGQVVVIHDPTLDRTTDGAGPVSDRTGEEVTGLDAGSWYGPAFVGQRVPRLDDVLTLTAGRARIHIELKGRVGMRLAEQVVRLVRDHDAADRVVLMSFDVNAVLAARRADPGIPAVAVIAERLPDQLAFVRGAGLSGLNQGVDRWQPETVERFHEEGLIVHGSLVNDPARLRQFFAMGGDTADSDEPACWARPVG